MAGAAAALTSTGLLITSGGSTLVAQPPPPGPTPFNFQFKAATFAHVFGMTRIQNQKTFSLVH